MTNTENDGVKETLRKQRSETGKKLQIFNSGYKFLRFVDCLCKVTQSLFLNIH
jgi:hypothetical protein